jgi:hypothetical protein
MTLRYLWVMQQGWALAGSRRRVHAHRRAVLGTWARERGGGAFPRGEAHACAYAQHRASMDGTEASRAPGSVQGLTQTRLLQLH